MTLKFGLSLFSLACLTAVASAGGTITNGSSTVGIDDSGTIYDGNIGFQRNDGFDPIRPGTPRDSWSIFSATNAYSDPYSFGSSNIDSAVYAAGVSTVGFGGGAGTLVQSFNFVASNVVHISGRLTNLGAGAGFAFRRNVDWDVDPTAFNELIDVPVPGGKILETSYYGFENPSSPFAFTGSGTFGPGDLGGGITINLGFIGTGGTATFDFYYGVSMVGQSLADYKAQLAGLGIDYNIVGYSSDAGNTNATSIGVTSSVPGPASLMAFGLGLGGRLLRRRSKRA